VRKRPHDEARRYTEAGQRSLHIRGETSLPSGGCAPFRRMALGSSPGQAALPDRYVALDLQRPAHARFGAPHKRRSL
jgi:hypothetical protein